MNEGKISIGIMAHVNAGKTTLTEQMLFRTGSVRTLGRVDDGTAHTDFHEIEARRGISVFSAVTSFEWLNSTINLIDTPGHREFAGEIERCLPVLDCAVLVVSAVEGVQCHTEVIAKALARLSIPTIVFVNKIDRAGAAVQSVFEQLSSLFNTSILDCSDVVKNDGEKASLCIDDDRIPDAVSILDDAFCEKYIEGYIPSSIEFTSDIMESLGQLFFERKIIPVCTGCALKGSGIENLLNLISMLSTSRTTVEPSTDETCGVIFKVYHDPKLGRMSYFKLMEGKLRVRDSVRIYRPCQTSVNGEEENKYENIYEKITQLKVCYTDRFEDRSELTAGDIGVICGFTQATTGDSFGDKPFVGDFRMLTKSMLRVEVTPFEINEAATNASPDEFAVKILELKKCLEIISDEDPTIVFKYYNETKQMIVDLTGKMQIEVLEQVIRDRFGLIPHFKEPKVIYKETPCQEGYGFDAYTMPKPCWAVLKFLITPLPRGAGFQYESKVAPRDIQYRYQNHVDTAIRRALKQGIKGWEVVDLKVTLVEGGDHNLHTHPLDFFVCTPMAFMDGLRNVGTKLLEPFYAFKIDVPITYGTKIMGALVGMRAQLSLSREENTHLLIEGVVPVATSMDFNERLVSMTKGEGMLELQFSHYDDAPESCNESIPYDGVNPLDRAKFILYARKALLDAKDE